MRFGVLGAVAAWTDRGVPVRVPEAKVRALLAVLLTDPGRPVPPHRLLDHLWPDRLPAHPLNALQGKLSHLRRVLDAAEPGARALVLSGPAGYRIDAAAVTLDAARFTALTTEARTVPASRPAERARLLTEALELWRGPAFADFADRPFALAAAAGLTEARLTAEEELAEARLDLGHHRELLAHLAELTIRHPLRQRLCAARLRALYRAGRQDEALHAYTELRRALAEELGLDPEPALAALHRQILRRDPALLPPAPARTDHLPAPVAGLLGRDGQLAQIRELLGAGRLVTLTGPGGIGKTRLALAAAREAAPGHRDGARLVELAALAPAPAGDSGAVAEAVLAALGVEAERTDRRGPAPSPAARLHEALRGRELLLLLDNCEHLTRAVADLLGPLLASTPGLHALLTSQEPLDLDGELPYQVPPLPVPADDDLAEVGGSAAARLFLRHSGAALDEENAAAVARLCRRLDGNPLALELAAARARTLGVHGLLARLDHRLDQRLDLLTGGRRGAPARQQTLRAVIGWSWSLLTPAEQGVLRRLAVTAEGCTPQTAAALCSGPGVPASAVPELLGRLVDRSLLTLADRVGGPRYGLLESVRAYALEQLAEHGELTATRDRHLQHYTRLALVNDPLLRGHDQERALALLDTESAELRRAVEHATVATATPATARPEPARPEPARTAAAHALVGALTWYWVLRCRYAEARRALTAALALGDHPATAVRLAAIALLEGGAEADGPHLRDLLARHPDTPELPHLTWLLGWAQLGNGDAAESEHLITAALTAPAVDHWTTAAALSVRARHALGRGELAAARADGERSSRSFRELGDAWGELQNVFPLAALAEIAGDYRTATRLHRAGLATAERLGLRTEQAKRLSSLGRTALLTGDLAGARALHEQARRLSVEQGHRAGELNAEVGLALGERRGGDPQAATTRLHRLLAAYGGRAGYGPVTTLLLAELGFAAEQSGDPDTARRHHLDGLAVARALGDPRALALALEGLAGTAAATGDHPTAARLLGCAAATRTAVGAPLPPAERTDVDRVTALARTALGPAAFTAHHTEGTRLPHTALVP
ncbi:BTAD domain-containing putative transcriptional regulator [Kitasatospora sp. NPDC051853]|uniref:BTAD domain-containing putative transcriptional regulator n=1 Tax=Kitasatospora sp. NPDC051853 TaxID=3364058 RepID=UPI0037A6F61E